jgi:hypothetical protein
MSFAGLNLYLSPILPQNWPQAKDILSIDRPYLFERKVMPSPYVDGKKAVSFSETIFFGVLQKSDET